MKNYNFTAFNIEFIKNITKKNLLEIIKLLIADNQYIIDIQILRFHVLLNAYHLQSAVWHAHKSIQNGINIAKNISLEFLLYLSGQRQIKIALLRFGIDKEIIKCGLVIFHKDNLDKIQNESFSQILSNNFFNCKIKAIEYAQTKEELNHIAHCFNLEMNSEWNDANKAHLEGVILSRIANLVIGH